MTNDQPTAPPPTAPKSSIAGLLLCILLGTPQLAAALCGDLTGDGLVQANDALAVLNKAVNSQYDPRGDVAGGPRGDGRLVASDALATLLAAVTPAIPTCANFKETVAAVSTASQRFDASGVAVVDLTTHEVRFTPGLLHRDSVVRRLGDEAVFLNRFGANSIQRVTLDGAAPENLKECSVADGFNSNPHDVIAVGDKAYVTLYEGSLLRVLDPRSLEVARDPACSDLIVDRINLGELADDDGRPEMDQLGLYNGQLLISLQILVHTQFFQPAGPGRLAIVDPATDQLLGSIELEIENPFLETKGLLIDDTQGILYIGGPGRIFSDLTDGGLEIVDLQAQRSLGIALDGEALGGDLFDLVVLGRNKAYAIVADINGNRVIALDPERGLVTAELVSSVELITDIEVTEHGELWVAFREHTTTQEPGLRIFSVADNRELTEDPIFPGSLPFTLTFTRLQ